MCAVVRPEVHSWYRLSERKSRTAAPSACCAVRMIHGSDMDGRATFLDTLTAGARKAFARLGTRCSFAVGDVLIQEGDHSQELMVLHQGVVKVTGGLDGDRAVLMDVKNEGDVVGEVAAMGLGPRSATVTADREVIATVIPSHELLPFLCENPQAESALKGVIGRRLRRSERWPLDYGRHPVPVRLARLLVELAQSHGKPDRNSVRIEVSLSQSELADLVASTTNTVQKMLAQLRADGLISTGERQTFVRDVAGLRQAARLCPP
ncbi:Crp/Fnr family transcriptional regulator [Streptomyces sp. NPDC056144]|uniref:Crp/Fnr family transcriptional regulator n=1 Tax=unclassified Streptomyces TaxID=2593676 RepID=UPI0035E36187